MVLCRDSILAIVFGVITAGLGFAVLSAGAVIGGEVGSFAGAEAGSLLADEIDEKI